MGSGLSDLDGVEEVTADVDRKLEATEIAGSPNSCQTIDIGSDPIDHNFRALLEGTYQQCFFVNIRIE